MLYLYEVLYTKILDGLDIDLIVTFLNFFTSATSNGLVNMIVSEELPAVSREILHKEIVK